MSQKKIPKKILKIDRREISRNLSKIESRSSKVQKLLKKSFTKNSFRNSICFTGPAGVGKSTLISKLASLASAGKRIAWLACDPSSMATGGSLLGDRIRIAGGEISENLFIRSIATRSTQAFSPAIRDMEIYLENFFEEIFVETAGSGQTQQEVARISGITVLILQPETGDEIQWLKSGVREWADLFVVNKSDLPGAELMMRSLIENGVHPKRILKVSSRSSEGLEALLERVEEIRREISWSKRLTELHLAHARDIFFEKYLRVLNDKFERTKSKRIMNPYL